MPVSNLRHMLCQFRRTTGRALPVELNDAELLCRFLIARDEAAFELLVWRHGITVSPSTSP